MEKLYVSCTKILSHVCILVRAVGFLNGFKNANGVRGCRSRKIAPIQPINMPNANIIITRHGALNILYPFTF